MTWTRLDDKWDISPKLIRAAESLSSDAPHAMWARAVTHCNRVLSDGRIHGAVLRTLTKDKRPQRVVDALVGVGALVALGEDEYEVYDFLEWNDSREVVMARREAKRDAGRHGGVSSGKTRRKQAEEPSEGEAGTKHVLRVCLPSGSALANPSPSPSPSPDPDPIREDPSAAPEPIQEAPAVAVASPRKRPPAKPKPAEPPHPRHAEVVDAYFAAFEARRGAKPTFGARDGAAVRALLQQCAGDADRAIAVVRGAYSGDPWLADRATIASIASDPSKYLSRAGGSGSGLQRNLQTYVPTGTYDGGGFVDT